MSFTEFYCRAGGSNMNGGGLSTGAEPSTTAAYSATNGGWNSGTGVFTPTSGNPSLTVTVGDWAHAFTDGSTTPTFVGRVTAVSSTTVTVSTTVKAGTAPTTAGTGVSLNVGGAWSGPTGAVAFPVAFVSGAVIDATGHMARFNLKNDQTYSVTVVMTHTDGSSKASVFQGYTATAGDGGKATIDGGTSGTSFTLLDVNGANWCSLADLIFQNNGATGSASGLKLNQYANCLRLVFRNLRGAGVDARGLMTECEAYACNQSNTANLGGFSVVAVTNFVRCVAHDNTGSNSNGFVNVNNILCAFDACVADTNGKHGVYLGFQYLPATVRGLDAYNNGGSGLRVDGTVNGGALVVENSNFVLNALYGVDVAGAGTTGQMNNCGFGSGAAANTSGATNVVATCGLVVTGSVTYASGVTPWVDPANGDFRVSLAAAKNAGWAAFTQVAASYTGAVGYPDIGSNQHLDSGGGTTTAVLTNCPVILHPWRTSAY